jgi:hypothetical protein
VTLPTLVRSLLASAVVTACAAQSASEPYVCIINQSSGAYSLGYARSASGSLKVKAGNGDKSELKDYSSPNVTLGTPSLTYLYPVAGETGWLSVYFSLSDSASNRYAIKIEAQKGQPWVLSNPDNAPGIELKQGDYPQVLIKNARFK